MIADFARASRVIVVRGITVIKYPQLAGAPAGHAPQLYQLQRR